MSSLDCFNRALIGLSDLDFCGVMHFFDESILVLENELGKYFDNVNLSYFPKGIANCEFGSLEERLNLLRNEIADDLFDHLLINNGCDLDLIKISEKNLFDKLVSIENWQEKLSNLRSRCLALR